jgi:glutamyl-tRNA reductase
MQQENVMSIYLVGLNHATAPIQMRDRVALDGIALTEALSQLAASGGDGVAQDAAYNHNPFPNLNEVVILSTCNRLEIYTRAEDGESASSILVNFLSHISGHEAAELSPHLYHLSDRQVAEHLMRVASGLDSMVLGEPQILGQVSSAYRAAAAAHTIGPVLSRLFTQAVHTGKRVRTETSISCAGISISHIAARLLRDQLEDLASARVLVLGAGEMAQTAINALRSFGVKHFTCMSRTLATAQVLSREIGIDCLPWHNLTKAVAEADVVFAATGAPHTILHVDEVSQAQVERGDMPLICVDIAVPRDIEPAVGDLPGVQLFDIDALQCVVDENLAQRQAAVPQVEAIVGEEVSRFTEDFASWRIGSTIAELREWADTIAVREARRAQGQLLAATNREQEVIERMAERIARKLIHAPTLWLRRQAAANSAEANADLLRQVFDLDTPENCADATEADSGPEKAP